MRAVARRLREAGFSCWIVGGAVRDLALRREVHDLDLATPALPDEIESIFANTWAVGKAFGTVVVVEEGVELQVTTFREDGAYSDARRPDEVRFGTRLELDARRRDFTANALYLDPLTDELRDPEGGLADLARGILRCVGDPARRFREDGLRLVRMARFSASHGLAIEAATREAARRELDALTGVSSERILAELASMAAQGVAAAGVRILAENGILTRLFPDLEALRPPELGGEEALDRKLAALDRLGAAGDLPATLAILFDPLDREREGAAERGLEGLPLSRSVADGVRKLWRMSRELTAEFSDTGEEAGEEDGWRRRATCIRMMREPEWESFVALGRAWNDGVGEGEPLTKLLALGATVAEEELSATPWIGSADLAARGLPPGPRWGELLREAEQRQLGGVDRSRVEALRWLEARVRELEA